MKYLLFIILFFLFNPVFCQKDTTIWTTYDSIPVLDSNIVFGSTYLGYGLNIYIDSLGKKYFISRFNGLATYNDTTWRRIDGYHLDDGLMTPDIYPFVSDSKGNIWFIDGYFLKSFLVKFDGKKFTTYNSSLHGQIITALEIDRYDNLIIGFYNESKSYSNKYSVSKYNVEKNEWSDYANTNFINSIINCFHIDVEDNIWIGTDRGVTLLQNETWHSLNPLIYHNYPEYNNGLNYKVRSIVSDANGMKWIATSVGLFRFDYRATFVGSNYWRNDVTFSVKYHTGLTSDNIFSLKIDNKGNKWIGTDVGLAVLFDSSSITDTFPIPRKYDNKITSISIDKNGAVWFFFNGSLHKLDYYKDKEYDVLPIATIFPKSDVSFCEGDSTVLTAYFDKNYSYQWYLNGDLIKDATNSYLKVKASGYYSVRVTKGPYQKMSISTKVTALKYPSVALKFIGDTVLCQGTSVQVYVDNNDFYKLYKYSWNNNDSTRLIKIVKSGNYFVDVSNSGCKTRSRVFQVKVNPEIPVINDSLKCFGSPDTVLLSTSYDSNFFYNWYMNGKLINKLNVSAIKVNNTGLYTVRVQQGNCIATSIGKYITIYPKKPELKISASVEQICEGDELNMFAYYSDGFYGKFNWDNNVTNAVSFIPSSTTKYTVVGDNINGCKDTATITIKVNKLPKVTIESSSIKVCEGNQLVLKGVGAQRYVWDNNVVDGESFVAVESKLYSVIGTDSNGCFNSASVKIDVVKNLLPLIKAVSSKDSICLGENITLSATGGSNYYWNNEVINGVSFIPSESKTYTVSISDTNGCIRSDSLIIKVNSLPSVVATASKTSICSGDNITLIGTGAVSYVWDNNVTNGVSFVPSATKIYTVTGTDANGCKNMDTVSVSLNNLPIVTISANGNTTICKDSGLKLFTNLQGKSYLWNNGETSPNIYPDKTGVYFLKLKDVNECEAVSNIIKVTVNQIPTVTISLNGPATFCDNQLSELISTIGVNYLWNDGSTTRSIKPNYSGEYFVKVTDINGCTNTSNHLNVTVEKCSYINDNELASVQVYPNPTNGIIHIKNLTMGDLLNISDINGRVIYTQSIDSPTINLSMPDFSEQGVYYLNVFDKNRIIHVYKVVFN